MDEITELNEIGAKIMGYKIEIVRDLNWTPATNIEQAFMVIREMLRDEKWLIVVRTMYDLDRMSRIWYECLIWKRDSETFYGEALIDQPALAILRCVAKTIEEKNDKTR